MIKIDPFMNEEASVSLSGLTIENRIDRVSLYGSIDLTRDRRGLERAREMKDLLTAVIAKLENEPSLPETIETKGIAAISNPFLPTEDPLS